MKEEESEIENDDITDVNDVSTSDETSENQE
jgi:hypothetical protein